ncbi:putative cell division cycle ATPase [Colletotrichum orbiculare MAFF 240422]|uniref:Cell division cycle ATPase n=1 Tax=Colletotrichum orbiculare (strain 104-T / ATCC 96160 / CBS 514.97 / LARS 414 / MAFF 240422) TaxID=1213857 RepID=A0A484G379_COLOR|nr:putative cell division cycle ATPase [Colletotrichum orbiculare MAFF 240422]
MANDDAPDAVQDVISATCERPVEVESRAGKINHYSTPDTSVTDLENDSTKPSQGVSDEASDPITPTEPVPTAGSVTEDDPAVDDAVPNEVTGEDQEPRAPSPSLSSSSTSTTRPSDQYRRYQNTMKEWGADDPGESVVTGLVDYIRTVEERLSTIENTLRKDGTVEDKEDDSGAASSTGSKPDLPEAIEIKPGIKFMEAKSSDFFSNGVIFDNVGAHSGFSSVLDDAHMLRVLYNKSSSEGNFDLVHPPPESIDIIYFYVTSLPMATFFREVLGLSCGPNAHETIRFTKPFRPLIRNMKPLRDHLSKLEREYGHIQPHTGPTKGGPITPKEPSNANEGVKSADEVAEPLESSQSIGTPPPAPLPFLTPYALPHFRAVVEFVDRYLGAQVALYEELKSGEVHEVAFENLWMMFDAGSTIYCPFRSGTESFVVYDDFVLGQSPRPSPPGPDHVVETVSSRARYSPQAYRVLATRGGVPLKMSLKPGGSMEEDEENDLLRKLEALWRGKSGSHRKDATQSALTRHGGNDVMRSNRNIMSKLIIACFNIEFDGDRYGSQRELFQIKPYDGLKDVRTLEVFPVKNLGKEKMGRLIQRGKRFVDLANIAHMSYEGNTAGRTRETCIRSIAKLGTLFETFSEQKTRDEEALKEFKSQLEENGLMILFPGIVPGYALRNRKWVQLDLDRLQPVQHGEDWSNLVLPRGHRKMVQAMVESYTRQSDGLQTAYHEETLGQLDFDLVRGKGKGCIILLHGAPGVGKTSTAECVAAYTKRPLYPITCGDIGHSPEIVEQNLEKHFKLAHRWACVLLLDEADVFLAKRTKTDVKRNGLVSVFLRILEYYPGILFLTTNRVGAIDDAFRSRLHLTLYYPKLKKKQTTKIWTNNINKMHDINEHRMKRGQPPIEYDENKIIKWAKSNQDELQWNGRQIRNAFQTAIALAEFQAQPRKSRKASGGSSSTPKAPKPPVLDQNIFTKIANASIQFTEYLHETHGQDEDAMASRDQVRSSSYKKGKHKIKTVVESSESSSDSDDSSGSSHHSDSSDSESDTESDSSARSETSESEAKADMKKKKAKSSKKTKEKDEKKGRKEKKGSEKTEKTKKKKKSEA